jgi:hypothetical protein
VSGKTNLTFNHQTFQAGNDGVDGCHSKFLLLKNVSHLTYFLKKEIK